MASTSLNARPRQTRDSRKTCTRRGCSLVSARLSAVDSPARRRIAFNFVRLSAAELVCRTTSVVVTLSLAKRLGVDGYGRIEFAFNVVFWLVLLLRDSSDVIVARELSRHPRLIRPLVDQVLAYKTLFALVLFSALALVGSLTLARPVRLADPGALRLDALHDGDRPRLRISRDGAHGAGGPFALHSHRASMRSACSCCVRDASRIAWVPIWLTVGEVSGIGLVWLSYLKNYRLPRPRLSLRFLSIMVQRGRTVCLIQLSQAVINTADLLVVGFLSRWGDVGRYGAPHRMVTALLTFGLILQQAAFPDAFAVVAAEGGRRARGARFAGRGADDGLGAGGRGLHGAGRSAGAPGSPAAYAGAGSPAGRWASGERPLLILAYLYQTTLIALNRETVGCERWWPGRLAIVPLVALLRLTFGLPGAALGVLLDRPGTGPGGLRLPGARRAAARLAPSPGPAGAGIAGDDTGLPGAQTSPRAARRARRCHHLHRRLGGSGGLASHAILEAGAGAAGPIEHDRVIGTIAADAS